MARKGKSKTKRKTQKNETAELLENMLPQNILAIGERVEENKNIYISQPVYKEIHKFTKNKTINESGGMLVGSIIEEFGKTNIVISGFVEAKFCEATPTTLTFTHETWEYVHEKIEKKYPGKKIVGWIHTHPDFGIFLSEYDKFIHQNFFNEEYQVAYVIDPIQNIEGFYFWLNEKIEKCKGFYIYDKTGTDITIDSKKESNEEISTPSRFSVKDALLIAMSIVVVFLIFSNVSTNKKLEELETQQQNIVDGVNQSLSTIQFQMQAQDLEIQNLNDILKGAGIIVEQEEAPVPDAEGEVLNE